METINTDKSTEMTETIMSQTMRSEIPQNTNESKKLPRKKLVHEYSKRGLDICGVCKKKI